MVRLSEELKLTQYDHDPDVTTAVEVGWVDMKDYDSILVSVFSSALTGTGTTAFKLMSNCDSSGGTDTTDDVDIVSHAVGSAPDAVGDYLILEASKDEIVAADEDGRYITAVVSVNNALDEAVVTYLRRAKTQQASNTADVVS